MLAISCKKNNPTESIPTQLRETRTSTDAVIGALGDSNYYKQNVIISFNGTATLSSAVDGDGNAVSGITYDSLTGIVNFDAITNSEGLKASGNVSNYTLTFSVAGETNGTFQIPVTLRKANIITNDKSASPDQSFTLFNAISNAIGGGNSKTFYTNSQGNPPKFDFGADTFRWNEDKKIILSNNQEQTINTITLLIPRQETADEIRNIIWTNGRYTNYFSDLTVTYDNTNHEGQKTNATFNIVFTPHFTNEMTNAGETFVLELQNLGTND